MTKMIRLLSILLCLVIAGCAGDSPLMVAAYEGKAEKVRELIAHGADVNAKGKNGETALMIATRKGHAEVVRELHARARKSRDWLMDSTLTRASRWLRNRAQPSRRLPSPAQERARG